MLMVALCDLHNYPTTRYRNLSLHPSNVLCTTDHYACTLVDYFHSRCLSCRYWILYLPTDPVLQFQTNIHQAQRFD